MRRKQGQELTQIKQELVCECCREPKVVCIARPKIDHVVCYAVYSRVKLIPTLATCYGFGSMTVL